MTEIIDGGVCRRALLVGAGGLSAAALLAACGGSEPETKPTTAGPGSTAPSSGATGGAASSAPAGGGAALAKVSEIPVGGGKVVGSVLIVQPQAGVIKGFNARCPHMGTVIDAPVNGVAVCSNHGSAFKAEDGSLVNGPATKGLSPILLKVSGDDIARA